MDGLLRGPDGLERCAWCGVAPDYVRYHDEEWGFAVFDDTRLFEKLCLEGFQAGLSWLTILRKREAFRRAFYGFQIERVARMGAPDVDRLLRDVSIVRHRGKIEAVIHNAGCALRLIEEQGSLARFVWSFEASRRTPEQIRTTSPESDALARALKKRGWRFTGPTTMYALFQAMGLVNDHAPGCAVREAAERSRAGREAI